MAVKAIFRTASLILSLAFYGCSTEAVSPKRSPAADPSPIISTIKFEPDPSAPNDVLSVDLKNRYLNIAGRCLSRLQTASDDLGKRVNMHVDELVIEGPLDFPMSGGNESILYEKGDYSVLTFQGPPNEGVICHESFHLFQVRSIAAGFGRPEYDVNVPTPLYEGMAELAAFLMIDGCHLVSGRGPGNFIESACSLVPWKKVRTIRQFEEDEVGAMLEWKNNSYTRAKSAEWRKDLNRNPERVRTEKDPYDSATPLASVLWQARSVCPREKTFSTFLSAWGEATLHRGAVWHDFRTFTPLLIEFLRNSIGGECANRVENLAKRVGLVR